MRPLLVLQSIATALWLQTLTLAPPSSALEARPPSLHPKSPALATGTAAGCAASGIIRSVVPQGNSDLSILLEVARGTTIPVWCSSGRTRVFHGGVAAGWGELVLGRRVGVVGKWISQEGDRVLYADRIDLLPAAVEPPPPVAVVRAPAGPAFDSLFESARDYRLAVVEGPAGLKENNSACLPTGLGLERLNPAELQACFSHGSPGHANLDEHPDGLHMPFSLFGSDAEGPTDLTWVRFDDLRLFRAFYRQFMAAHTGEIARSAHAQEFDDTLRAIVATYQQCRERMQATLFRASIDLRPSLDRSMYDLGRNEFLIRGSQLPLGALLETAGERAFNSHFHCMCDENLEVSDIAQVPRCIRALTIAVSATPEQADSIVSSDGLRVHVDVVFRTGRVLTCGHAPEPQVPRTLVMQSIQIVGMRMQIGSRTAACVSPDGAVAAMTQFEPPPGIPEDVDSSFVADPDALGAPPYQGLWGTWTGQAVVNDRLAPIMLTVAATDGRLAAVLEQPGSNRSAKMGFYAGDRGELQLLVSAITGNWDVDGIYRVWLDIAGHLHLRQYTIYGRRGSLEFTHRSALSSVAPSSTPPLPPPGSSLHHGATRVIAGHEIEENVIYYIEMIAPAAGIQPGDRLTRVEFTSVSRSQSTGLTRLNSWMNIPGAAALFRTTDRSPRFLIWTTQDNASGIRVARCQVKKDSRMVQLDPNENLNFFKDWEGSQASHYGYTPPVHVIAVKGPLKPGEYVLSTGPAGPVAAFGIDATNN
jgi:hypothetical protein